jgi:hypothetical protein
MQLSAFLNAAAKSRLVHFLAIGAVLAAFAPKERDARVVKIDPVRAEAAIHSGNGDEQAIVDGLVDEEVLAREAVRLGIGTDDPIVRARLAERMRSNLAAALPVPAIPEDELAAEIARRIAHAPERVRLAVWFVPKERADAQPAAEALARAVADGSARPSTQTPIPDHALWTEEALARVVGVEPARIAIATPAGKSTAALASAWGFYIFSTLDRRRAEPAEVRAEAALELTRQKQSAALAKLVDHVRHDYKIEVPPRGPGKSERID